MRILLAEDDNRLSKMLEFLIEKKKIILLIVYMMDKKR